MIERGVGLEASMDRIKDGQDRLDGRMTALDDRMRSVETILARIEGKLDVKMDYKWALTITAAIILIMLRAEIFAVRAAT